MTQQVDLSKIKEKIRALKALASDSGATTGEVEAAMNLAQKLCHQYALDLSEITDDRVVQQELEVGMLKRNIRDFKIKRVTWMDSAIAGLFDCDYIYNSNNLTAKIVGTLIDRETADYCIDFAHNSMNACWNKYKRSQEYAILRSSYKAKQLKRDFMIGFIDGVRKKCDEMKASKEDVTLKTTSTSLMIVKSTAIEAFKNKNIGKITIKSLRPISIYSKDTLRAGLDKGHSIEFTRPVTGKRSTCQALPN